MKKRVELVEIEYFKAKCVNPPEGIKSLDWIKEGFQVQIANKIFYLN